MTDPPVYVIIIIIIIIHSSLIKWERATRMFVCDKSVTDRHMPEHHSDVIFSQVGFNVRY